MSLSYIFGRKILLMDDLASLDAASRAVLLLTAYVQEVRSLELVKPWIAPMSSELTSDETLLNGLSDMIKNPFEPLIQSLAPDTRSDFAQSQVPMYDINNFRYISILRFVPTRILYAFSRWQTSEEGARNASQELTRRFIRYSKWAKTCLLHAARLFYNYRVAALPIRGFEPIFVLGAALYIEAYIRLVPRTLVAETLPGASEPALLRIDLPMDEDTEREWTNSPLATRLHMTGIGLLAQSDSVRRLLKESARILMIGTERCKLSYILGSNMLRRIDGVYQDMGG